MSVVDRFICRREGHKPSVTLTRASGLVVHSFVTTCLRCGRTLEIGADGKPVDPKERLA